MNKAGRSSSDEIHKDDMYHIHVNRKFASLLMLGYRTLVADYSMIALHSVLDPPGPGPSIWRRPRLGRLGEREREEEEAAACSKRLFEQKGMLKGVAHLKGSEGLHA